MSLDRFELLDLRLDDGIQTYHAREVATRRPVQVHLFGGEAAPLLTRIGQLPDADRRRVLDRGTFFGRPYLVTDRLAGFASLREWIEMKTVASIDEQFARLFDTLLPEPTPPLMPERPESKTPVVAIVLGTCAALVFLILLAALYAFRPH